MADRTQSKEAMTRSELAAYLTSLAEEFEAAGDELAVAVGNKTVTLHPPEEVDCEVEVVERASVLRGNRETVSIELSWKP